MKKLILALFFLASCSAIIPKPQSVETMQKSEEARQSSYKTETIPTQLKGVDYLGGVKFCDAIIAAHPRGYAAGFFIDTFGSAIPCINRLAKSGKSPVFRIHLAWSDSHVFNRADFDRIAALASQIEVLSRAYPAIKFYVSGACEHNLGSADAKLLRAKVLAKCPHCAGYVNTVLRGALIDGINEVHGMAQNPHGQFFYSTDGTDLSDIDAEAMRLKRAGAIIDFGWGRLFNCRPNGETRPPKQRTTCATTDYIQGIVRLLLPKGSTKPLAAKWIYKPISEKNTPVIIAPLKTSVLNFLDAKGHPLTTAKYFGAYVDGRSRYYLPDWGWKIGRSAVAASGSELITIKELKGSLINPAFREGEFR